MPAPPSNDTERLSRREELSVSGAAMSGAPVGAAAVTGGVLTLGDLGLHLIHGSVSLGAVSGSLSFGVAAFLVVAAAGALLRSGSGRAVRWARANPWSYAALPGVAAAVIAFVLSVTINGGIVAPIFSALWHGGAVFGLTGAIGAVTHSRKPTT